MESNRDATPTATHYLWIAHALFLLTFYGSLIPLRYHPLPLDQALERFRGIAALDPSLLGARGDWVLNTVQYAALSFFFMSSLCVDRRRRFGLLAALAVFPGCCVAAVVLEFLQVYFPPRTVSVNDLAVESLGALFGTAAWLLAGQRVTDWVRRFWGRRGVAGLAGQLLPAYLFLLFVSQLMPFDLIVGSDELARKYQEGRVQLVPLRALFSDALSAAVPMLLGAVRILPLGLLLALIPWHCRAGLGGRAVLAIGLGVTTLIEGLQVLVWTRYCDATDVLTGTAAVLLGWRLGRSLRDSWTSAGSVGSSLRVRLAAVRAWGLAHRVLLTGAWVGVLLLINWQPFDFSTDLAKFKDADPTLSDENTAVFGHRRMTWAPFVDYYWNSRYEALDQCVRRSLSFAPLGALMALWPVAHRRRGLARVTLTALTVGLVIELGQYFIPERHPSTTDLLIQTSGALLAFAVARHLLRAVETEPAPSGAKRYRYGRIHPNPPPAAAAKPVPIAARWMSRLVDGKSLGALVPRQLDVRVQPLLRWIDAVSYGAFLSLLVGIAVVLTLGFVLLARALHLV